MGALATRRLNDAAAALPAAERALLNLWVQRGLGDSELADMTGMSISTIASRRATIIARLSDELGLPPGGVELELAAMAATSAAEAAEAPVAEPVRPEPAPAVDQPARPERSGRRRLWRLLVAGVVVMAAVLAVVLLPGGSGTGTKARAQTLAALPGGLTGAHGSTVLTGKPNDLRLVLKVIGLPAVKHGHYEVWLYDSILDSVRLGQLGNGVHAVSFRLPPHAGAYRFIDVSFQPLGVVNHSGESVLRAENPAAQRPSR